MADVIDLFQRKFSQEGRSGTIGDEHARRGWEAFQAGDYHTAAQEMMQAIQSAVEELGMLDGHLHIEFLATVLWPTWKQSITRH